jgi:energy-converting hydrogenase Eha subunit E
MALIGSLPVNSFTLSVVTGYFMLFIGEVVITVGKGVHDPRDGNILNKEKAIPFFLGINAILALSTPIIVEPIARWLIQVTSMITVTGLGLLVGVHTLHKISDYNWDEKISFAAYSLTALMALFPYIYAYLA